MLALHWIESPCCLGWMGGGRFPLEMFTVFPGSQCWTHAWAPAHKMHGHRCLAWVLH